MEVRSTCGNCGNHIVEQCSCPSPPPDVVEAARRLQAWKNSADWNTHEYITDGTYDQDEDIETVCGWIIQQAEQGKSVSPEPQR